MSSESITHRRFVLVLSTSFSALIISLLAASLYIETLDGELTRLGSYSERDFGWNLPQKRYKGDARMAGAYEGRSDVLVIGDSFSTNGVWQPFFNQKTGLSYVTLDIRKTSLTDLLASEAYRKYPPKIMVVEVVERELLSFFKDLGFTCARDSDNDFRIQQLGITEDRTAVPYEETRTAFVLRNINLRYTAAVILNSFIRGISKRDTGDTRRFMMVKSTLFSNRKSGEILVYSGDMNKFSWKNEEIERAVCSVKGFQDTVQANGKTLFIFMVAPDKSTAYAGYMENPLFQQLPNMHQLLVDNGVNIPRTDLLLRSAIARGMRDVYVPSGTHWGAAGYEMAAAGLVDFLTSYQMDSK